MEQTPVDQLTGIPLPIVPHDEVPELLANARYNAAVRAAGGAFADWNHAYHPKRMPVLTSQDGRAVRDCRGQFVMRNDHTAYHNTYAGPPLPRTAEERFRAVVFCAAGYVPRQAMDFSGGSVRLVTMPDEKIQRLQASGEIRMMQSATVRQFLHDYVLNDPQTSHIPDRLVGEFMQLARDGRSDNPYDQRRQRFLAHKLLAHVIDPATEPLYAVYRESREARLWRPEVHASPRHIVQEQLLGKGQSKRRNNIRQIGNALCATLISRREGLPAAA